MLKVPESPARAAAADSPVSALAASDDPAARIGLAPAPADPLADPDAAGLYDHLRVRDAMTTMNLDGENLVTEFRRAAPAEAGTMAERAEDFVRERGAELAAGLTTREQKRLFDADLAAYRDSLAPRVAALGEAKTREYLAEVTDRQGQALTALATSPENVFDDARLADLRRLYVAGAEQSVADLAEAERPAAVREREGAYWRAVLDTRLDHRPDSAGELLENKEVARALGKEACAAYRERVAGSLADRQARDAARACVAEGLDPDDARPRLEAAGGDAAARYYAEYRYRDNLARADGWLADAEREWRALAGDIDATAIAPAVRRDRPELAAFLEGQVAARRATGGRPPEPDYAYLVERVTAVNPEELTGRLGREAELYADLARFGGADTPAAGVYARFLRNSLTATDAALLGDLADARAALAPGAEPTGALSRYVRARDEYLRRHNARALLPAEQRALLDSLAGGESGGMRGDAGVS